MHLGWRQPNQGLVRAVLVVPGDVAAELVPHRVESERHEDSSDALRLPRANAPRTLGHYTSQF